MFSTKRIGRWAASSLAGRVTRPPALISMTSGGVSLETVGNPVGEDDGNRSIEGTKVGIFVGAMEIDGRCVGTRVGKSEGGRDGLAEGFNVEGAREGSREGANDGARDGDNVEDGTIDGDMDIDGLAEELFRCVGAKEVGEIDGPNEGEGDGFIDSEGAKLGGLE